ncbi:MAG TPA: molybdate ABC transporter permease subunit [Pirellulaceae bacterium]
MSVDLTAFWVSMKLAFATTILLFAFGLPLAYWLSQSRFRGKFLVEALVALPLVLPPTVLGFYVLAALGPRSPCGRLWESWTGARIPFTFLGILLGSLLFNLPFAVRPFTAALTAVDRRLLEASWCLGVSRISTFFRVMLPLAWPGILAGIVLTFAHTIGEFGVVYMVGANIPGVTRTLSTALYDDVQALNYASAARTSLVLLFLAFLALCATQRLERRANLR